MRVLLCNKYNFPFSGAEVYLFEMAELLRKQGHDVAMFSMSHPANKPSRFSDYFVSHVDFRDRRLRGWAKARLAWRTVYSAETRRCLRRLVSAWRPDIAHVRNVYHHLSPSLFWELRRLNVPTVYHLNDFKILCPNYNLVSHGQVCERCPKGSALGVILERCHGDSTMENTVLAAEAFVHRALGTYRRCVSRFIAPSAFCKAKLIEHGWVPERIDVVPHFQALKPTARHAGEYVLYSGRLAREKGIGDLLGAMARLPQIKLVVAGDGPEASALRKQVTDSRLLNVEFAGHLSQEELGKVIEGARLTVMPSRVYETFGKVILESYAWGRPVIASRLGTRPELVEDGKTGLLFAVGDVADLAGKIEYLFRRPHLCLEMGRRARVLLRERFSPETHYAGLMDTYSRAVEAGWPGAGLWNEEHPCG